MQRWLGVLLVVLTASAALGEEAKRVVVTRENDAMLPQQSGWVQAQGYAAREGDVLLRSLNRGDKCLMLRSPDGGKTWPEPEVVATEEPAGQGITRCPSMATLYVDPDNGLLVRFLSEVLAKTGECTYGNAVGYGPHTMRIFSQVSRDQGRTWEPKQQLIEQGRRYNSRHWARDVWYGRSGLCIEGQQVHKLRNGTLVIPAYLWPTTEYLQAEFDAQQWPEELRRDAPYFIESRCLLLKWKPDLSGFTFTTGGPMVLPGGYTFAGTCGSDEAAIAYLDDQRWFAVVRTSTGHVDAFKQRQIPLERACLRTDDGGATWRQAEPLRFDDGATVHSPSAWSQFVHSSRTGKWYWIGNIVPQPCYGTCDPRYPLQIVELDTKSLRLKRSTVTVIEDKAPEDDKWVRFSNFRTYEERGTGDFILLLTKSYCEFAPAGLPTPAYRYRIRLSR